MDKLKELRKKTDILGTMLIFVFIVGVAMAMLGILNVLAWDSVMENDHLLNPDMPRSAYPDDATFVWTYEEISQEILGNVLMVIAGILVGAIGLIGAFALPTKKDFHLAGSCDVLEESMYCSQCGLKLSELRKKT